MDPLFLDDGCTRDGHVAAEPGLHGSLGFRFRPALAEERYHFARQQDADGKSYARRAAALVSRHVLEWDAPAPLTPDRIGRLHPNVLNKVLDQVLGYTAADPVADAKN